MSQAITMARPYAKALYQLAEKLEMQTVWLDKLNGFAKIANNIDVQNLLINPNVAKETRVECFTALIEDVSLELVNFLQLLSDKGRLIILPSIALLFKEIYDEKHQKISVKLVTAHKVDDGFLAKLKDHLKSEHQAEVDLLVEIDKSLIAGGLLKFGDKVIDVSLKTKIQRLAQSLII
jgi:F-type H+-transporting ATPase subunit delta